MIAKQPFGRTGHRSTRTVFGAAALGGVTQEEADRTLEVLMKYGVNHIDTAASYGNSELRIGPWMGQYRQQFFLATKTGERTYQEARKEIHRSLGRLRVEQIDLIQLHNLVDEKEWEVAMGPGGALEAAGGTAPGADNSRLQLHVPSLEPEAEGRSGGEKLEEAPLPTFPPEPAKVNINTASAEEIQAALKGKGIGPVLAGRIVEHRRDHPFQRI